MRYEGKMYRPPSESDAYLLQATIGCSWNKCTYCDMYREKAFRVRDLTECLADLRQAGRAASERIEKVFVADGDALILSVEHWLPLLEMARAVFPRLRRVSCYAMASNVLAKSPAELRQLQVAGLARLYIGPESGDPVTLKRIAKGGSADDHVAAAERAHAAGIELSVIGLLGAGGIERTLEHACATADLITAMDPAFFAALTLTVVPDTPQATLAERGRFQLPCVEGLLHELHTIVDRARPSDALFRTNHASNYLPLGGRLPRDRGRILAVIDDALAGRVPLRPELLRGL